MYVMAYYYWRQGIPLLSFPLPLFGSLLKLMATRKILTKFTKLPPLECYDLCFGKDKVPKMFMDFRGPDPVLMVADPNFVNELYVTKNKFFDKDYST